jgi:hypothetical protein
MKKKLVLFVALCILLTSCGSNMVIEGKKYETVGLVNIIVDDESTMAIKDPKIKYDLIIGNLIWGIILIETVIAPIYFFGFSLFEPVGLK